MEIDRILFLIAAICWFIGALRAYFKAKGTAIDWWLAGAGFVALTFVF